MEKGSLSIPCVHIHKIGSELAFDGAKSNQTESFRERIGFCQRSLLSNFQGLSGFVASSLKIFPGNGQNDGRFYGKNTYGQVVVVGV